MTKRYSTKKALMASALSLLLCFSMLIGTTFAWFTDSVTSANNIIKAGNLDVELYYQAEGQTDWTKVTETTNVFKENALWEPGHTEVVKLKIVNEGSLALKYQLSVNVASETGSTNALGNEFKLSDYIKYGVVDGAQNYTRDAAIAAVDATATALKDAFTSETVKLLPLNGTNTDNEDIVTMVVYMPTSVGNDANHKKDAATKPEIKLGINLVATQVNHENDSFDASYDINADYPANNNNTPNSPTLFVGTAAELAAALTPTVSNDEAKIVLSQDIELAAGETWTPLTLAAYGGTVRNIVIDGQGHTIKGLNAPLIGHAYFGNTSIEIKNLTLSNANIEGAGFNGTGLGAFVGAADNCAYVTFDNCHLIDSTIKCTGNVTGVGGIIGFSSSTLTMNNCSVTGTTVIGPNDSVGALIGHTYVSNITNAKVVNCELTGESANKSGYVVGTVNANTTITTSDECAGNKVFGAADSTAVYGRISGATLILNGVTLS